MAAGCTLTPADLTLARRAVACAGWRWLPGMLDTQGARLTDRGVWDMPEDWSVNTFDSLGYTHFPDLADPAALGCLLALVREAHDAPHAHTRYSRSRGVWEVTLRHDLCRGLYGDTEAAALVAALEAACRS